MDPSRKSARRSLPLDRFSDHQTLPEWLIGRTAQAEQQRAKAMQAEQSAQLAAAE
jgi:hypothetical protein